MKHKNNIQPASTPPSTQESPSLVVPCTPEEVETFSRRELLSRGVTLTGYASIASFLPFLGLKPLMAQTAGETYTPQRRLVWINLNGGWDILEATDPKPASTSGIDQIYDWSLAQTLSGSSEKIGRWLPQLAAIGQDIVVLRGLAMGTTSHMAGSVYMDTGILSNAGRVNAASIPSIVASESQATIPIIQLNGGSDPQIDRGLLNPVSVVRASNLDLYRAMYPTDADKTERQLMMLNYLKNSLTRIEGEFGTSDRLTALKAAQTKIVSQLENNVGAHLVLTDADRTPYRNATASNNRRDNGLLDAFALTEKLIRNDMVTSINLGLGGFDTHAGQSARLEPILTSLDTLLRTFVDQLRSAGKLDTTLIVLYSDFGRTPKINNSNGRDHWPVGGAMLIGGGLAGGRVVGATDDNLLAVSVNTTTGASDASGTQLNPTHLGGSVLALTLGSGYLKYRPYLSSIPALTRLKGS